MPDIFATPDEYANGVKSSDLQASLGERLGAQAADALDPSTWLSGAGIGRAIRQGVAGGYMPHDYDGLPGAAGQQLQEIDDRARAAIPDTSIEDAKARVKQEGLEGHVTLPDQASIKTPVLDLMMSEAHERRDREFAIARGPQGFIPGALGFVTEFGAGMIDPVNAAAFSIPVLGEARWGKLLASAGDSVLARGGVRTLQGAAQGAVGSAALAPADWWLHTRDGQDYTFGTALQSVLMGAGMGGAFHAGFGGIRDIWGRLRGAPLEGSPEDLLQRGLMIGRHIPAPALDENGITDEQLAAFGTSPVWAAPAGPVHPAEALTDLPPEAREDAARVAIADTIADQPARVDQVLDIAADHDPRVAESFDAYHGSPHDFDRFDINRIGTGEGAQSYGHGLYFAENEAVARRYRATTSDKAFVDKVRDLYDEGFAPDEAWEEIQDNWKDFTPAEQRLMTALQHDDWLGFDYPHQAVSAALRDLKRFEVSPETAAAARAVGNMYRVRIGASHEHFLDWDKSIGEQSPHVRAALARLGIDESVAAAGEDAYRALSWERARYGQPDENGMRRDIGPVDASAALRDAGVAGIKYLDQGSRHPGQIEVDLDGLRRDRARAEDAEYENPADRQSELAKIDSEIASLKRELANPTRNFVVFDDKHIEITHKNGEPVELPPQPEPRSQTAVTINGETTHLINGKVTHGERAAAAAEDPRWRELSETTPAENDPQVLAESREADRLQEPASLVPERSLTALEAALADAEEAWKLLEPTLSEEERTAFAGALDQLKDDREARETIIRDGVACLIGAVA